MGQSAAARDEVIDGRFRLQDSLGSGAMGAVYRATDLTTHRDVALKLVLEPGRRPERKARFRREGQVAASLEHPGIVSVHTLGEWNGCPYLVYELVEGAQTLERALVGLTRAQRLELVRQTAEALGHAHQRGVVHRDVKPDNILVTPEGQVRVTDFGLALAHGLDRLTQTGGTVGTPYYMAPEQALAQREKIGPATDVWALGVILYAALTETPPWPGSNIQEIAGQILTARPRPPRRIDPTIPSELEAITLRALSADPQARFADGAEFARALVTAQIPRGRLGALLLAGAVCAGLAALGLALTHRPAPPQQRPAPIASSEAGATPTPSPSPTRPTIDRPLAGPPSATPAPQAGNDPLFTMNVRGVDRAHFLSADLILISAVSHAEVWSLSEGRSLARFGRLTSHGFSWDGKRLLLAPHAGGLQAFDLRGRELARAAFGGQIDGLSLGPKGETLVAMLREPPGLLLLTRETLLPRARVAVRGSARFVRHLSDGSILVASRRGHMLVYDSDLKLKHAAKFNGPPYSLAVTPDEAQVLVGNPVGSVFAFTLPQLQLRGVLKGKHPTAARLGATVAHLGRVEGIAVSADGRTVWTVSGSRASKIQNDLRVWDLETLSQRGVHLAVVGHYGSLELDPTGTRLLISRRDSGAVEVWPVSAFGPN